MISVIMSVFNGEKYLERSIHSILEQTYKEFEFLILDDASTDNTANILTEFTERDSRIKVFHNSENLGLTKSLNYLVDQSKNDILARQDVDDFSEKNRFFEQLKFLKMRNIVSVFLVQKLFKIIGLFQDLVITSHKK